MVANVHKTQVLICIDDLVGSELATVFETFQHISILLNMHYHENAPIHGALFHECISYMQSKLLMLIGHQKTHLSQCICLAMVAFFAATFRLPEGYRHPCCTSLAHKLHSSYISLKNLHHNLSEDLTIWLIFACLISTDAIGDLSAGWRTSVVCQLTWDEVRQRLKRVFWIDAFHDDIGRKAYQSLFLV